MTSNRNQRAFQAPGHVFDKTSLAAACWPFQDNGQTRRVCCLKKFYLLTDRKVIRLVDYSVFFDCLFGHVGISTLRFWSTPVPRSLPTNKNLWFTTCG